MTNYSKMDVKVAVSKVQGLEEFVAGVRRTLRRYEIKIDVENINHSNTLMGLKRRGEVRIRRRNTCDLGNDTLSAIGGSQSGVVICISDQPRGLVVRAYDY